MNLFKRKPKRFVVTSKINYDKTPMQTGASYVYDYDVIDLETNEIVLSHNDYKVIKAFIKYNEEK